MGFGGGKISFGKRFGQRPPSLTRTISSTSSAEAHSRHSAAIDAASPAYATVLLGLGARELSMAPPAIPRVRRVIEGLEMGAAAEVAAECLGCADADEVEELVRVGLGGRWPNLFPPEILPPPKSKG